MRSVLLLLAAVHVVISVETEASKKLKYAENDNADEAARRFQALEIWAKENKVDMSKVGIAVDTSRGAAFAGAQTLALRNKISAGEMALKVPAEVCMSSTAATKDPQIGAEISKIPPLWRLAIWLLHQKLVRTDKSKYAPYIRSLPPYVSLPVTYTEEDKAERWLVGTNAAKLVISQRHDIESSFTEYMTPLSKSQPTIFPPELFIAQEWQWAVSIIW